MRSQCPKVVRCGPAAWMQYYFTGTSADIAKLAYSYDLAGNRRYQEDLFNSSGMDEFYEYDTLNRLTGFARGDLNTTRDRISGTAAREQAWTLDAVGNWSNEATKESGTYLRPYEDRTHNTSNEITNIDPLDISGSNPASYTPVYDAAGNLTDLPTTDSSPNHEFIYDFRNRLIEVQDQSQQTIVRYYYDGLNRLAKKDLTSGEDVIYLYDGWRRVRDYKLDGTWKPVREYIWGGTYIDELLAFSDDTDADGYFDDDGGSERYIVCQQANFNVVAVVKASTAAIVEKITYDPYGGAEVVVQPSQQATGNVVLFQGREWDDDADLYYFRNRWYSPRLGRFMQRDPMGYVDGASLYELASSEPVNKVDPLGLEDVGTASFVHSNKGMKHEKQTLRYAFRLPVWGLITIWIKYPYEVVVEYDHGCLDGGKARIHGIKVSGNSPYLPETVSVGYWFITLTAGNEFLPTIHGGESAPCEGGTTLLQSIDWEAVNYIEIGLSVGKGKGSVSPPLSVRAPFFRISGTISILQDCCCEKQDGRKPNEVTPPIFDLPPFRGPEYIYPH